ncbi:hypothetical protein BaRGS_00026296 [Batillaria attramentaria]|uniref:Uncharacterized protein n=1 Tax=Batillaria attramentaria TaxID=370345 RepID=A0ABD0K5H3_9CAEN
MIDRNCILYHSCRLHRLTKIALPPPPHPATTTTFSLFQKRQWFRHDGNEMVRTKFQKYITTQIGLATVGKVVWPEICGNDSSLVFLPIGFKLNTSLDTVPTPTRDTKLSAQTADIQ